MDHDSSSESAGQPKSLKRRGAEPNPSRPNVCLLSNGRYNVVLTEAGSGSRSADPRKYSLGRELFSYEPYAFVVRRDDSDFRLVANRALAQVYRTGQIEQVYGRWFGQAGIKPSPVFTAMYALQSLPE